MTHKEANSSCLCWCRILAGGTPVLKDLIAARRNQSWAQVWVLNFDPETVRRCFCLGRTETTLPLPLAAGAATSSCSGPRRDVDGLHGHWHPAMVSMGAFGVGEDHRADELRKTKQEPTMLTGSKTTTNAAGDKKRCLNVKIVKHTSFRKFLSSALGSLLHTPCFRETTPRSTEVMLQDAFLSQLTSSLECSNQIIFQILAWISLAVSCYDKSMCFK